MALTFPKSQALIVQQQMNIETLTSNERDKMNQLKKNPPLNLPRTGTMKIVRRVSDEISALRTSCDFDELCLLLTQIFELPDNQLTPRRLSSTLSTILAGDNDRERVLREERVNRLRENPAQIMFNLDFKKQIMNGELSAQMKERRVIEPAQTE
jgi:hypothetical protein